MKRTGSKNLRLARETLRGLSPQNMGTARGAGKISANDDVMCSGPCVTAYQCVATDGCEDDTFYDCGPTKADCLKSFAC